MKKIIRRLIPNRSVNLFKHLPTAVLANLIYGFPSKKLKFIGVTGTDGKTTTVNLIYQILKSAGRKVSMVSTINAEINGKKIDTGFHVTNPDHFLMQDLISRAVKSGSEIFVLEVTSHGLEQYRDWGIKFEVGVVTNITHEHLDYHGSWENYFKAKSRLVKNSKTAVLNRDENYFERLSKLCTGKVVSFGLSKNADFNPQKIKFSLKIPGSYNMLNALAALAAASAFGVEKKKAIRTLENFDNLEGRMQSVKNNLGIKIVIDFAHTPNGLENVLRVLKKQTKGKLIAVFGSAGARDKQKRPIMGRISAELADFTVVTAEDPRGEIEEINEQILSGAKSVRGIIGKNIFVENNRQKAIEFAIKNLAKKGDTVGIFGKGHEKTMNLDGKSEIPWSDEEAARKVLNEGKN